MAGLSTPHQLDHPTSLAAAVLTDDNRIIIWVIAAVALAALVVAGILVRQVLAAGEGTDSMKEIATAIQEGANAYLARQMRTLGVFAVVSAPVDPSSS
jgi:K(+)-stimulated pyrophosphate-energized sodium pump